MRVFVTGATGAIGRRLIPRLVESGHQVTGTTRTLDKVDELRALGAEAAVVDGLDGAAVGEAVARAEPEAIIHQATALAGRPDMRHFDRWFAVTNALRTRGTEHLLAAASASGVGRFIAQSYTGWNNIREGRPVVSEDDPFDPEPAKEQRESLAAIRFQEKAVAGASLDGIVLRYGSFYGPGSLEPIVDLIRKRRMPVIGTGAGVWSWIHLDDAASATVAALERGGEGVYNLVDDEPAPVAEWLPYLAKIVGARPPVRVPVWVGRILAGEVIVRMMTESRGASNRKAREELGWEPVFRTWRDGFRDGLFEDRRPRWRDDPGRGAGWLEPRRSKNSGR